MRFVRPAGNRCGENEAKSGGLHVVVDADMETSHVGEPGRLQKRRSVEPAVHVVDIVV
jgi:hypothetical protein